MKESMNHSKNAAVATAVQSAERARSTPDEAKGKLSGQPAAPTDTEIATAALDAIHWITTVPTDSMEITAQQGRLFLRGTVENLCQREAVKDAVQNLDGVTEVTNLIGIRPRETALHCPV